MAEFTDLQGDEWKIHLTYGDIRKIRKKVGVDLLKWYDPEKGITAIAGDDDKLLSLLWRVVEKEAKERGIDEEGFYCLLDETVVYEAFAALNDAVVFFFREDQREIFLRMRDRMREADRKVMEAMNESMTSQEMESLVATQIELMAANLKSEIQKNISSTSQESSD